MEPRIRKEQSAHEQFGEGYKNLLDEDDLLAYDLW
jgi:hypothetical protein